jgi:hypothetical protein
MFFSRMIPFGYNRIKNLHANCVQENQLQPLFPGCFFSASVPPAPEELPLHPLWELPAPALSPLQAVLPDEQLLTVKVEPAMSPATQKPARIFFSSLTSMLFLLLGSG